MLKIKQLLLLFLFTLCSFSFGEKISDNKDLIVGKLPNGLTYFIYKNQKPEGKASLNLIVSSGSLNETDPQQGLAHFLEHMAFNGTTKFKKNELIKYLQSLGLDFGGDLNAYTSFGETVYKLQIPTKTPKDIDEGVEVLREWASEITLAQEEVEKEKPIILEEWRLRQGLTQRLGDAKKKAIFGNSRYFERFPIGLTETIEKADPELLRAYYEKWYTPQNMAVAAVGDFDPKVVEETIKKQFSYDPKVKFTKGENYTLGNIEKKSIIFTDPEITYVSFEFTTRKDHRAVNSTENFRSYITDTLLAGILNTRLSTLTKKKNSPILQGYFYSFDLNPQDDVVTLAALFKENQIQEGMETVLRELKNMAYQGPTKSELSLEKEQVLKDLEDMKNNRSSITHEALIEEIKNRYLSDESFIEPEEAIEIYNKLSPTITQKDIEDRAREIYDQDGVYFLTAPESMKDKLPKEEDILKTADKIKAEPVVKDTSKETDLTLKPLPLKEGTIVSIEDLKDYERFTLSNGIEVLYKETDFDRDKITIHMFKEEGSSGNTRDEYLNLLLAPGVIANSTIGNIKGEDQDLFMKGKNFSVEPYITDYEQGITLVSNRADLNTGLEYMTYLLVHPNVDEDIFANIMEHQRENIKNRENSPGIVYRDKLKAVLSQNNPRRAPLTTEDLNRLSKKEILSLYTDKFSNFKGFKVIMVGSIDKSQAEEISKKYFASLPVSGEGRGITELGIKAPEGNVKEQVVKGVDKKATVTLIYPYHGSYSNENRALYSSIAKILNIVLIEDIREKMGGVYSIGSSADVSPENHGENRLLIRFSTDVPKAPVLTEAVRKVLKDMEDGKLDEKTIDSVVKNYAFNYEAMLKTNAYWTQSIYKKSIKESEFKTYTPEEYKVLVTKENVIKFMKEAVDLNNSIEVVLLPEKTE